MYIKDVSYGYIKYSAWFYKGGSVDLLYLKINDILEDNLPYMQSDTGE